MKIEEEDCKLHGLNYKSIIMESSNKRKRELQENYIDYTFLVSELNNFQFIKEVFLLIEEERMDRNIENAISTYLKERCWLQHLLLLLKKKTEHEKKRRWKDGFYGNLGEAYFHIYKVFELEERDIWSDYLKVLKSMKSMENNDTQKARLSKLLLEEIEEHGVYLTQVTLDVNEFLIEDL